MFSLIFFVQKWNLSELLDSNANLYDIISVERGKSTREIKKTYQRFIKQKQATVNPSPRQLKIWKQQEFAFSILSLDHPRAIYDQLGLTALTITDFNAIGYQSLEGLEMMKKVLGEVPPEFENYGGVLTYPIEFSLSEFITGSKRRILIERIVNLKKNTKNDFETEQITFDLKLPKGAPNFFRVIGKGIGDSMEFRGAADVIFICTQKPNDKFERIGRDILTSVNVTIADALSLDPLKISGPQGEDVLVNVTNAQNGEIRRIFGGGLPDPISKKDKGDLLVRINLQFPDVSTKKSVIEDLL